MIEIPTTYELIRALSGVSLPERDKKVVIRAKIAMESRGRPSKKDGVALAELYRKHYRKIVEAQEARERALASMRAEALWVSRPRAIDCTSKTDTAPRAQEGFGF